VVGAGQAGLAMSRCLAERSIDHVLLERGEVANSWKTERWDSLRLLTPNWQSRLPGFGYEGDDPDGYRTMPETVDFLDRYAQVISAPVQINTAVTSVRATDEGYVVSTGLGDWRCPTIVLATGACNIARIPAIAEALSPGISTLTPMHYRNPDQLEDGGVFVVGASATGTHSRRPTGSTGAEATTAGAPSQSRPKNSGPHFAGPSAARTGATKTRSLLWNPGWPTKTGWTSWSDNGPPIRRPRMP